MLTNDKKHCNVDNKYQKVLLAAQRARQLQRGARPRIYFPNLPTKLPLNIATKVALLEIKRGLVCVKEQLSDPIHYCVATHRIDYPIPTMLNACSTQCNAQLRK